MALMCCELKLFATATTAKQQPSKLTAINTFCLFVVLLLLLQGWGTVALAQGGITLNILFTFANRPPLLSILLIFACGALLMVTGMWLTVQFRFVQMQYPAVVLAFERQVLTASLPIAAAMQAIGIAAVAELGDVPYYLAAVLCLLYHMLARPLESSFHQSKAGRAIGGAAAASADATIQVGSGAPALDQQQLPADVHCFTCVLSSL